MRILNYGENIPLHSLYFVIFPFICKTVYRASKGINTKAVQRVNSKYIDLYPIICYKAYFRHKWIYKVWINICYMIEKRHCPKILFKKLSGKRFLLYIYRNLIVEGQINFKAGIPLFFFSFCLCIHLFFLYTCITHLQFFSIRLKLDQITNFTYIMWNSQLHIIKKANQLITEGQ